MWQVRVGVDLNTIPLAAPVRCGGDALVRRQLISGGGAASDGQPRQALENESPAPPPAAAATAATAIFRCASLMPSMTTTKAASTSLPHPPPSSGHQMKAQLRLRQRAPPSSHFQHILRRRVRGSVRRATSHCNRSVASSRRTRPSIVLKTLPASAAAAAAGCSPGQVRQRSSGEGDGGAAFVLLPRVQIRGRSVEDGGGRRVDKRHRRVVRVLFDEKD